jgi:hypothetical protein
MVYQIGGHEMPEFKVGDRVYCPVLGVSVYKLAEFDSAGYPLVVDGKITLRPSGLRCHDEFSPVVFHATPENQAALEALYGVKFEDAPKPVPVGSDLTRWLLAKYGKPVLCYVDDVSDDEGVADALIHAIERVSDDGCFVSHNGTRWSYAVPISNATIFTTAADYAD